MPPRRPLSEQDRRALLACARRAISVAVVQGQIPPVEPAPGALAERAGVFVTLRLRGRLRGCIGRTESDLPLTETVAECAIGAALNDPRFHRLTPQEAAQIEIEISILSPLQPISPQDIEVGKHGLLIARDERRGLLLPQVAGERHWSAERFLEATCEKAGLPPLSWREPGTQILGFTVEEFSDSDVGTGYSSST